MRKSLFLAVLAVATAALAAGADDSELFSTVRLREAVDPSAPARTVARSQGANQPSLQSQLPAMLLAAGYTARVEESGTLIVNVSGDGWTADVSMQLSNGDQSLQLAMALTDPEVNTFIAPKTLRGLLKANHEGNMCFALSGDPLRIELMQTISTDGLSAEQLKQMLRQMIDRANQTQTIWSADAIPFRSANNEADEEATTTPTTSSLKGKWVASPSATEAFALSLEDGAFRLIHVSGSQSTKSSGTWTMSGDTLTLSGSDGTRLAGTITRTSGGFTFVLGGGSGKSVTLTFAAAT